jgi:alkylation response protein AidB-like acyl-CoA dehydrogenase
VEYDDSPAELELRAHVRQLLRDHLRPDFPTIFYDLDWPLEAMESFVQVLADEGLLTLSWPEEYGGRAASLWSQVAFSEEMWGHNEPRGPHYMGVNWIGPAIMAFGTEKQKRRHLPALAAAQEVWCQGFSEPGAGSDLASLQLKAERTESGFRLNGQKVWNSYALLADWCILAARTSSEGRKQNGITTFLIPMDRPGIEVRAIPTTLGPHHLHEMFFTDVVATEDDVLGQVDHGWEVMSAGLQYERVGVARYARSHNILSELHAHLDQQDDVEPQVYERLATAFVHAQVARLLNYRVVHDRRDGGLPSAVGGPVARIASTTLDQEVADLAMDALGPDGLLDLEEDGAPLQGHTEHHWRYAQSSTVAAGTLEIQKMLIARSALGAG